MTAIAERATVEADDWADMNDAEMAKRVLMHDATDTTTASGCATAIGSVYQKLHYRLVPLIGVNGMRALFARSVQ